MARENEPERDYVIRRGKISVKSVPYAFMAEPGIGYLRLTQFSERSHGEVRRALDHLEGEGMKALVFDLRDNPGGLLDQAFEIAEEFVPRGQVIVSTRGRDSDQNRVFRSRSHAVRGPYPIVVLVNGGSASAAEVLAGALQDLDLAVLVGFTTFGKASVQSVFDLDASSALKLTVARYYTPSGRNIHREDHEREILGIENDAETKSAILKPREKSSGRPIYHTASGRVVYGGGGIVPDVTVPDTSFSDLMVEVARHGVLFRFATHYAPRHRELPARLAGAGEMAFRDSVRAAVGDSAMRTWPADRARLIGLEEAEITRRLRGDDAGQQLALRTDPAAREAFRLAAQARTREQLLRLALAAAPPGKPPRGGAVR